MREVNSPTHLSDFQKSYSEHIRSPETVPCPEGIPEQRSRIYQELLFNNTHSFVEKCFPVAQTLFSQEQWLHLAKTFFKSWSSHTPLFSKIPYEFVQFIEHEPRVNTELFPKGLPPWLSALLHYEYLELEVELSPENFEVNSDTQHRPTPLVQNPTLEIAQYQWPVHQIRADAIPNTPELTTLFVFRDTSDSVRFMEANPITAALVNVFEDSPTSKENALEALCTLVEGVTIEQAMQFGLPLLEELVDKQVLIAQTN